jgi:hypothetical protein
MMYRWVKFRRVDCCGIHDAVEPTWDGVGVGVVFWSDYIGIKSRFSVYAGLFCLNPSSIPGYA